MTTSKIHAAASGQKQVEAIHGMLTAGRHAVLVEPHTFVVWGLAGALWLIFNRHLFSAANFPDLQLRALLEEFSVAAAIALTAVLDLFLTKRLRRQRDESYTFVQRQLGKLSLLLAAVGVAAALGVWFHSWGPVIFVLWTAIVGMVLFIHGLFSEQSLEWAGLAILAAAIAATALHVSFEGTRWLLVATCGLGLPTLGLLQRRLASWALLMRLLVVLGWTCGVCVAAFLAYRLTL